MQIFREGRDFIEAQNWQRAAEKFNDFIKGYPKIKISTPHFTGMATRCRNRIASRSSKTPGRLMNRFPNSSWRQEAQALLVVLGPTGSGRRTETR
jgi:outer membrane protein assembly factor BamD (BamD/ComL family)